MKNLWTISLQMSRDIFFLSHCPGWVSWGTIFFTHVFSFSYIIGDKSILQDAGIQGKEDVDALPPPSETKDNIPSHKFRGDVSYFICTRPGRGPVLLSDKSQALLNPETGLPK